MASSKISREKLKRNGSFQKKEPPPPPPDEHLIPDVKLEDFEMLKTIGKSHMLSFYVDLLTINKYDIHFLIFFDF